MGMGFMKRRFYRLRAPSVVAFRSHNPASAVGGGNTTLFAMRTALRIILALGVLCMAVMFLPTCRAIWQFDHLERNAKKVVTAAELQAWATNLLGDFPTNAQKSIYASDLGPNFPRKLLKLYHRPPAIFIFGPTADWPVPHLTITWGGGFIGHTGFEVGPTNFPGWRATNVWAPGVYSFTHP